MAVHGVLAENEALRDVTIRETHSDQVEHLQLASAQPAERGVGHFGRKRHARFAELPEHRLGAGALRVCSDLPEVRDGSLDLVLCLIAASQCAQRCGEVEPHATGFERSITCREHIDCVLE